MESSTTAEAIEIARQIQDYDEQILALKTMRDKAQEEYNKSAPPVLEIMRTKKRKAQEKVQGDFSCLKNLLEKDKINPKSGTKSKETEEETKDEKVLKKVVNEKRNIYSNETKKLIVDYISEYGYDEVEKQTGIPHNSLKTIKKAYNKTGGWGKRGRKVQNPDFDSDLLNWILEQRLKRVKITTRRVMLRARKIASERKYEGVNYGWGWLRKFLRRHNLSLRKPSSTAIKPYDAIKAGITKFVKEIRDLLASDLYDKNFVFNLDETSIMTESTKGKTIEQKGLKRVKVNSVGKQKEGHTILLGGTMTGRKLPALIIIKGKGVKLVKSVPRNVRIQYREEGSWMDKAQMKDYIKTVLRYWAEDIPVTKRGLLLLDNFRGHFDKDIEAQLRTLRIDVKTLPPNTTCYLQPMDLSVNAPFKQYYNDQWDEYQMEVDSRPLTPAGNFKAPTKEDKISWISAAWEKISEQTIKNGFKCYTEQQGDVPVVEDDQFDEVGVEALEDMDNINTLRENQNDIDEDNNDLAHLNANNVTEAQLLDYEVFPTSENSTDECLIKMEK